MPDGFDFAGYRATAAVRKTIAGSVSGAIEIDRALRARMEEVVRHWEAGERFAPCFFGSQHRYEANTTYLAFLARSDVGWDTIAAYPVSGSDIVLTGTDDVTLPWRKRLILGNETYHRFFSSYAARNGGPDFTNVYGDLWYIEQQRLPLNSVLEAIAGIREDASISPPTTGDAGLR